MQPRPRRLDARGHRAATLYLLTQRFDGDVDAEITGIISRSNESVGGVNDDAAGYHDTITRSYVSVIRLFLRDTCETGLPARVNALLASPIARSDWPMRFYTRALLFSVPARRWLFRLRLPRLRLLSGKTFVGAGG